MKSRNMKSRTHKLFFIVILLLNIIKCLPLNAGSLVLKDEEEERGPHLNQSLIINERIDNPSEIFVEIDNKSEVNNSRLLSEFNIQLNENAEENLLVNGSHSISNSYILAFQENPAESISNFLALKSIASLIVGFGPSIPQLAIASTIGEYYGSKLLGYSLMGTTILTIEGITSWMMWEFIDDARKLVRASKQNQPNISMCSFIKGTGVGVLSLALGALSSAPDVYKTYKYNSIKSLCIISFIYDTIPRTIGFYKFFSSLKLQQDKFCEEESIIRRQGAEFIDLSQVYFLNKCKEKGLIDVAEDIKKYNTPKELYSYLSENFEQNVPEETLPSYYANGVPRKILKYSSLIFPIASATFNMVLAYKGYNIFIENELLLSLLSSFSVFPTFFLNSYVIMQASDSLFDKIYLYNSKIPSAGYFGTFHPKTNIAFICTSLLLGTAASVSGFYLIADNLENTLLSPIKYMLAALAVGTDLTFGTYTIYSTMINFGEVIKEKYNQGSSYILKCLKKLNDLRDFITNSSSEAVRAFVNDIKPHSA